MCIRDRDKDGPFLSDDSETPTPPWTSLRTLEEASRQFENDESGLEQKWINQLIKPGSSLGGARPKATVLDTKGNLWIAKFPSKHDDINAVSYTHLESRHPPFFNSRERHTACDFHTAST